MLHRAKRLWVLGIVAPVLLIMAGLWAFAASTFTITSISPNPFNPKTGQLTTIRYTVPTTSNLRIYVTNSSGTEIRSIVTYRGMPTGTYQRTWDGKDRSGAIVPDGTYTVRVSGTTYSGGYAISPAAVTVAVLTATAPPPPPPSSSSGFAITGVSPNPFNPSSGQSTTISYTVPTRARLRVFITNSSGTEVRSIVNYVGISAGSYKRTWNGKNSSGAVVPAGDYTVNITGTNYSTGATISAATASVTVQSSTTTPPPVSYSFAISGVSPNPFTPDSGQSTTISYSVPTTASVTIAVLNSSGSTVRSLANLTNQSAGSKTQAWDGKDNNGSIATAGIYTVRVSGSTSTGTAITAATASVEVEATPPPPPSSSGFTITGVSPDPFNPSSGLTTISYTVPTTARLRIFVTNSSGTEVRSIVNYVGITAGSYKRTWDGKNNSGAVVPAGDYTVNITGTNDSTGATIGAATASVTVQSSTTPPPTSYSFAISGISPDPFTPSSGQSTTISYSVPTTASVTIAVLNSSGSTIRTLANLTNQSSGNKTQAWDGKNSSGSVVAAGTYTVRITGSTSTGTAITAATADVVVQTSTTPPPPPSTGSELGQTVAGAGSANFAWLKYAGYKYAISITAPKSGTITQMLTYWKSNGGYGGGNKGKFNFELQTNGAGNFPSGTVIGRATGLTPNAQATNNGEGAFRIPLTATLTAGQIYHLVITNVDPSPATNWSSPNTLMTEVKPWAGGDNRVAYYSGGQWSPWTSQDNVFNTSGGNNVNGTHAPTMLTWSDGSNTGDPYYSSAISGGAYFYGSTKAGQNIVWNKPTTSVSRIGIIVGKRGSPAPLTYHFEKVGTGDIVQGTIATASQVGSIPTWVYVTLPSAVTLTQGQTYRLWFESPSSTSSNTFYQYIPYGDNSPAAWLEAGWGGTHCYYIKNSGSSWSSTPSFDMTFSLK
ncbi:MAG: FlgD immunoglobulin-like domain containing protein [Armatimonadota bacterium]